MDEPAPSAVAEALLGREVRAAEISARSVIAYDPFLPGRSVERVDGVADVRDGGRRTWSAIVKRTEGVGLRAARRELDAYRIGIADPGDGTPLRAPQLLASRETPDWVEVWLELLTDDHAGRWPLERFGVAGRHIGAADARARHRPVPRSFDAEDAWAERHGQPERVAEAVVELDRIRRATGVTDLAAIVEDPGLRRTEGLVTTTAARIARLAELPTTMLHHDLVRSNLFALGSDATGAIDWENVGRGPLGVDLAPLVSGSVRRGEAAADDLPDLERLVLEGYVAGLAGTARDGDVVRAYRLAVGLRWHVVLGALRSWLDPASWGMRGSRRGEPRAESLRHLMALTRYILDTADAEPL